MDIGIFLANHQVDEARALELKQRLEREGYRVWHPEGGILPGQDMSLESEKALSEAELVLLCFSQQANTSPGDFHRDFNRAVQEHARQPEGDIFLIPILLEECERPAAIRNLRPVAVHQTGGFDRLLLALESLAPERRKRILASPTRTVKRKAGKSTASPKSPVSEPAVQQGLTWLHLSDLHFKARKDWRQDKVLDALMRDVIQKLPERGLVPDMVFVTGDIAYSGKDEEYALAIRCFDEIARVLERPPAEHWYIVPGNHDVDRSRVTGFAKGFRASLTTQKDTAEILADPQAWASLADRQKGFLQFTGSFLGRDRAWSAQTPWRVECHEAKGTTTAVMCLNSAWACQDDQDHRRILIGGYQVGQALSACRDMEPDLRIALVHHPFDDLQPFDARAIRGRLTAPDACHFLLRGHLHETSLLQETIPGSKTFTLAAGACWQDSEHPHAVTIVQLDPVTQKGTAHVWNYTSNNGGFWKPANDLYPNMDGRWTFDLPWPLPLPEQTVTSGQKPLGPRVPPAWARYLQEHCGELANPISGNETAYVRLKKVYVPLFTDWLTPEERKRFEQIRREKQADTAKQGNMESEVDRPKPRNMLTLLEQDEVRHILVIGDPGSGKSTFARFAALEELARENGRLPLLLELKEFGAWLKEHKGRRAALWPEWVGEELADRGLDEPALQRRIGRGEALWILDGLDEIFDPTLRHRAVQILAAWFGPETNTDRLLITTRPHVLQQHGLFDSFHLHERAAVLPLDDQRQELFLKLWSEAMLGRKDAWLAKTLRVGLWHALQNHERLDRLRSNPLMLGTIAMIYAQGKRLPERRADLYGKAIDILLQRRFGPMMGGSEERVQRMYLGLMAVARAMTENGLARDIGEREFLSFLKQGYYTNASQPAEADTMLSGFARDLSSNSGILSLEDHPPQYSFVHLGFQEYLAACSFGREDDPLEALRQHLDEGPWREVILLTAGFLSASGVGGFGTKFVRGLIDRCCQGEVRNAERMTLALRAAAEAPPGMVPEDLADDLRKGALCILEDEAHPAAQKDRIELALALGTIGDPRLGMFKKERWVYIEPGSFTMGDDDTNHDDDKPAHRVKISQGFWMARYPVTNQEYDRFVGDGGYEREEYWSQEGWSVMGKKLEGPGRSVGFTYPNQPVVDISWYEAEAFCIWLTKRFLAEKPPWLKGSWKVALPTEAQWEFAAKGRGHREYPWGKWEPDGHLANFEGNVGKTTPVGCYPKGGTPDGLLDMAGNVLEWCRDAWESDYKSRFDGITDPIGDGQTSVRPLRGGSWRSHRSDLRSAYRLWCDADYRSVVVGFRPCVLLSPSTVVVR